ncbi:hypothetical protein [Archangium lansingense]|uniref:Secreted protein n=1 Tax=Archangium lansingense TaxID=2995310 RepID=A0ABT4AA30_9BACT|nr:hypothetical protein [Archangium lansinium]MCY1078510.1 hypothetical protein [Archangium lansinium]
MKRKTIAAILGALGLASTLVILPTTSAKAQGDSGSCTLYAKPPFQIEFGIAGDGGRMGCTNNANITVRIREHRRFLPDRTRAQQTGDLVNGEFRLSFPCPILNPKPITVFTETLVNGTNQKVQSPRRTLLGC